MNKEYKIKLDLNKKLYNKKMAFNQFDENVNDFYIEVTKNNEIVKDLDKAIVVLAVIKPNKEVDSQFVEVENGVVYANLKPSMKDEIGIYTARAMLILESEKVVTDVISYEVKEDKIFSLLNDTVETTEEFTLLTDMLSRLSTIELNENNREETFNNIKDEFEIIKNNHNELVTTETDNKVTELLGPVVSKANEKINEVDNKIVDIENAISEADSKIDNAIAKIPPKSELIGEKGDKGEKGEKGDKGDRGEQGLQGIQGIQGIQGERGLQGVKGDKGDKGEQGIQGLKGDKGDKGDRGEQGVKGDTPSITHLETSINNKIQEVETRFNTLTSTQQQSSEVIDARDGETSLKARLDRDIEKANKELDRVKKLEESTVSTVTTENDFTTVEATSNGYFEDVKLEGKTLVNLLPSETIKNVQKDNENFIITDTWLQLGIWDKTPIKPNTTYTIIVNVIEKPNNVSVRLQNNSNYIGVGNTPQGDMSVGINVFTSTTTSVDIVDNTSHNYLGFMCSGFTEGQRVVISKNMVLLEGDHTQNPPSYFEGLKSVGDGADEIVVSSVNENLFDINEYRKKENWIGVSSYKAFKIQLKPNTKYTFNRYDSCGNGLNIYVNISDIANSSDTKTSIWVCHSTGSAHTNKSKEFITNETGVVYINTYLGPNSNDSDLFEKVFKEFSIYEGTTPKPYIPPQSDKKRLLYYNEETQTWEKPILREWDSIEKHANGKYYYHQRSGEVVLNGSENWNGFSSIEGVGKAYTFSTANKKIGFDNLVCDKLPTIKSYASESHILNGISGTPNNSAIWVSINNSITDIERFKQWLQTNNVTVVYQLAQEKVYECTNIDLITYANETNYVVESGTIVPKSTLKVHNNISNVVSLLQKKVSLLESNMTKYMITQNRMQLASTYSADSVTFKVDYFSLCSDEENYDEDLYNLILNNILVGKDNYDYDKMFTMILDYASWNQISWEQFDILVGLMDMQHNPPVEEIPTENEVIEETPNEIM